jgi:hypothetical protein
MGNNRITGLADGLASTDAASVSQVTTAIAGLGTMSTQNANNVAITGGTINGTSVGATTASTGAFTNFTASGTALFTSTGAVKVPVGTTAEQPTPVAGMLRYNSTTSLFEGYGTSWASLGGGAAGSNTQVQYNNGGALAGSSALTFNGTTLATTTLQSTNLSDGTNSTSTTNAIQGSAKAWVNFNGTGTVAIRASYNVSSITDNGTGDYTVNFTNAFADANYSICASSSIAADGTFTVPVTQTKSVGGNAIVAPTTSAVRLTTQGNGGSAGARDAEYVNVSIFR